MKMPFNRIEALIFSSLFPLFVIIHWNGFLSFFYDGIAQKIGSTTGFGPALVSATAIYLVLLVGYYFLKKIQHQLFANRWRAGAILGTLALIMIGSGFFLLRDFWSADTCLSKNGVWNYQLKQCETIETTWSKEKYSALRNELPILPPLSKQEIEHQAWVYAANKLFQDRICLGEVFYDPQSTIQFIETIDRPDGKFIKIICNLAAYNEESVLIWQQDQALHVLNFPSIDPENNTQIETKSAMGLRYDDQTNTFSTFTKFRGLGDCGSSGTYVWNTTTKKLELQQFLLKATCDGKITEWPNVLETKNQTKPTQTKNFSLDEPFTLSLNEIAQNSTEELTLEIQNFVYAPCPEDVQCISAGNLTLTLRLQHQNETFILDETLDTPITTDTIFELGNYQLQLEETDYQTFLRLKITQI